MSDEKSVALLRAHDRIVELMREVRALEDYIDKYLNDVDDTAEGRGVSVTVRMPAEMAREIDAIAASRGWSRSQVLNEAIRWWLEQWEAQHVSLSGLIADASLSLDEIVRRLGDAPCVSRATVARRMRERRGVRVRPPGAEAALRAEIRALEDYIDRHLEAKCPHCNGAVEDGYTRLVVEGGESDMAALEAHLRASGWV